MIDRAADLRAWAAGRSSTEAAVELLIRARDGRLLAGPWIVSDGDAVRFDPSAIDQGGSLSSSERRLLEMAGALAADRPVLLGGAADSGIGRLDLELILAAITHAMGSHHSEMIFDAQGRPSGFEQPVPRYLWPEDE